MVAMNALATATTPVLLVSTNSTLIYLCLALARESVDVTLLAFIVASASATPASVVSLVRITAPI